MKPAYTVIWKRSVVKRDLASIVLREMQEGRPIAPITRAMDELDRRLAANPELEGESRDGMQRILIELPLAVTYETRVDDRIVVIRSVRHIPPTRSP